MATKRTRPETVTVYLTAAEKHEVEAAAKAAGLNRQDWVANTLLAVARQGLVVPEGLARLIRAEAKRTKVEARDVLAIWITTAARDEDKP